MIDDELRELVRCYLEVSKVVGRVIESEVDFMVEQINSLSPEVRERVVAELQSYLESKGRGHGRTDHG